jgi:hypothetical protein
MDRDCLEEIEGFFLSIRFTDLTPVNGKKAGTFLSL